MLIFDPVHAVLGVQHDTIVSRTGPGGWGKGENGAPGGREGGIAEAMFIFARCSSLWRSGSKRTGEHPRAYVTWLAITKAL